MTTAEIVNRLGSARSKLNEALAEIDALQEELVQRHKAGNNADWLDGWSEKIFLFVILPSILKIFYKFPLNSQPMSPST